MALVVDSSVCVEVLAGAPWVLGDQDLVAPALLDSELLAVARRLESAGVLDQTEADRAVTLLDDLGIRRVTDADLRRRALDAARRLGWSRTYDAEYVALAEHEDIPLVTGDLRLLRGAARLVRTLRVDDV